MFITSAPGTLMIAGEHAVLHNKKALVTALDKRVKVTLIPRTDQKIVLYSRLGELRLDLAALNTLDNNMYDRLYHAFRFVLTAIQVCLSSQKNNHSLKPTGFDLKVDSEFSHTLGLGSSAAVTVATVAAVWQWLDNMALANNDAFLNTVFLQSREVIRQVQGYGSGADVAAAVYGGVILYQLKSEPEAPLIQKLSHSIPLVCVYSGSKKPTPEVIQIVRQKERRQADLFAILYNAIEETVNKSVIAIESNDWKSLGDIWNIQQGLMTALGVSNLAIDQIIHQFKSEPTVFGAKISGSGLGDCVIGVGTLPAAKKKAENMIDISVSKQGLQSLHAVNKKSVIRNLLHDKSFIPVKKIGKAFAPSNIALCKYWGKRDPQLNLPCTSSLSISLGHLGAETEISILTESQSIATHLFDSISLNGQCLSDYSSFAEKCRAYLDLFRPHAATRYVVKTTSNIPIGAGLASSACGFAALVMALNDLYGWQCEPQVLSQLARMGSGSASRSLWQGFVEWQQGSALDGSDSYGIPLQQTWNELCIGLVIINAEQKTIPSRTAMQLTQETSPFYSAWPAKVAEDLFEIKKAIQHKDFTTFGETVESNAEAMHALMMSARPSILYSEPETLSYIKQVQSLRKSGLAVYFTQDAGPNLKLLFLEEDKSRILQAFPNIQIVQPFYTMHSMAEIL